MDPRREYEIRLQSRRNRAAELSRRDNQLSNARLISFMLAAGLLIAGFAYESIGPLWFVVPLALFIVLVVWHARVIEEKRIAERAMDYYAAGLGRLDGHWRPAREAPNHLLPENHPYAADLDVFGPRSLFGLLNAARTRAGEEALAGWLLRGADAGEIRARQAAAAELRERIDFREDLALLGDAVRSRVRPAQLCGWAGRGPVLRGTGAMTAARVLTGAVLLAVAGWLFFGFTVLPLLALFPLVAVFQRWKGALAEDSVHGFHEPEKDLAVLAVVARRIESETFTSPWLSARREQLFSGGRPASASIAQLDRWLTWLETQGNQFFAPIAFMVLWRFHLVERIESWRLESGVHVKEWLRAIGEIEALASLSMYAFENPEDVFPEIVERERPLFDAAGLGHPLLPKSECVANDVRLDEAPALYIVSGSNMSGKSTLLRSVGVAAVMAFAGAPVRAKALRLTPMAIGASISTHDSIQAGTSRFYAEIQRIRDIVELARSAPVLFLIDEALHGTNSHDRRIGASAILRTLVDAGAIGLVTTHDLALTEPLEQYGDGRAVNLHFEDHLEDGRLVFDYKLRPGVVQKSNAIELMRSIGLDV